MAWGVEARCERIGRRPRRSYILAVSMRSRSTEKSRWNVGRTAGSGDSLRSHARAEVLDGSCPRGQRTSFGIKIQCTIHRASQDILSLSFPAKRGPDRLKSLTWARTDGRLRRSTYQKRQRTNPSIHTPPAKPIPSFRSPHTWGALPVGVSVVVMRRLERTARIQEPSRHRLADPWRRIPFEHDKD